MKKYHVTFLEKPSDRVATGMTINALDELQALDLWRRQRPSATFLYIAGPDLMAYKY